MRPLGIFGGSFDPIHYGHLRSAFEVLQALRFEEIRFIPCGDPAQRGSTVAAAELRLRMVEVATREQHGFTCDDRELRRAGPSYTIDTLATLREEFPQRSLALILGMDAFLGLSKWHRWYEILDIAHIVVAHRPGWQAPGTGPLGELIAAFGTQRLDDLHDALHGRIHSHAGTQFEISSTEIRDLIAAGRDARFLMPDAVRDVIKESRLYESCTN